MKRHHHNNLVLLITVYGILAAVTTLASMGPQPKSISSAGGEKLPPTTYVISISYLPTFFQLFHNIFIHLAMISATDSDKFPFRNTTDR